MDQSKSRRTQLHRALSKLGLCSRSQAITFIKAGKVIVNTKIETRPLTWVDLELDSITIKETAQRDTTKKDVTKKPEKQGYIYLALDKPKGYITTRSDERGRKTVYDLLALEVKKQWLFPVGRLDKDSEGLLLMTNDGPWANKISEPESHISKTYRVTLNKEPREADLDLLRCGIQLVEYKTKPALITRNRDNTFSITIQEGKNRQIRMMFSAIGCRVKKLVREQIGILGLQDLQGSSYLILSQEQAGKILQKKAL